MNSEIRARKKKFAALVTVMMLVMCNVMPAFAATHTADEWMRYGHLTGQRIIMLIRAMKSRYRVRIHCMNMLIIRLYIMMIITIKSKK